MAVASVAVNCYDTKVFNAWRRGKHDDLNCSPQDFPRQLAARCPGAEESGIEHLLKLALENGDAEIIDGNVARVTGKRRKRKKG